MPTLAHKYAMSLAKYLTGEAQGKTVSDASRLAAESIEANGKLMSVRSLVLAYLISKFYPGATGDECIEFVENVRGHPVKESTVRTRLTELSKVNFAYKADPNLVGMRSNRFGNMEHVWLCTWEAATELIKLVNVKANE